MRNISLSSVFLGCILFAVVAVGVVNSIECYVCGSYSGSGSSVTRCLNLTEGHLQQCPPDSTHCIKHVGPAINVYGCTSGCEERRHGQSFEAFCCNENKCNGGSSLFESRTSWVVLSVPVAIAMVQSLGILQALCSTPLSGLLV